MLLLIATLAAAADIPTSDTCAEIERFTIEAPTNVPRSFMDCCASCSLGYLRATDWVTSERMTWDNSLTEKDVDWHESRGSGDLVTAFDAELREKAHVMVEKQNTNTASVMRPCGRCVTYNDCLDTGGVVNTWHRTCERLNL